MGGGRSSSLRAGPSLLGIRLVHSLWIRLPGNRGMPFSKKGVPPTERGTSHILCEKSHWFRFHNHPWRLESCLVYVLREMEMGRDLKVE